MSAYSALLLCLVAFSVDGARSIPYTTSPIQPKPSDFSNLKPMGGPLVWKPETIDATAETSCLKDIWMPPHGDPVGAMIVGEGGVIVSRSATNWTTTTNDGFPNYYYGVGRVGKSTMIVAGFYDGGGESYGIMRSSSNGGQTWGKNQNVGTPWAGLVQDNLIAGTSSSAVWRLKPGSSGANASDWLMSHAGDGWLAGPLSVKGDSVNVTGSSWCASTDGAKTFKCHDPVDPDGDGGIAYSTDAPSAGVGITGGGDISPTVNG
jgi:hypothetical protein